MRNAYSMGHVEILDYIHILSYERMCIEGLVQARRWKDRINKLHTFHNYVGNQCPAICGWVGG